MIRVGPGEVGTPKGNAKQEFIDLCKKVLNANIKEHKANDIISFIRESDKTHITEYILNKIS